MSITASVFPLSLQFALSLAELVLVGFFVDKFQEDDGCKTKVIS